MSIPKLPMLKQIRLSTKQIGGGGGGGGGIEGKECQKGQSGQIHSYEPSHLDLHGLRANRLN